MGCVGEVLVVGGGVMVVVAGFGVCDSWVLEAMSVMVREAGAAQRRRPCWMLLLLLLAGGAVRRKVCEMGRAKALGTATARENIVGVEGGFWLFQGAWVDLWCQLSSSAA